MDTRQALTAASAAVCVIALCTLQKRVQAQTESPPAPTVASVASAPVDPQMAGRILSLFREKTCFRCHASDAKRPKKFNYIDDLAQLRADPKLVVPGEPDQSELVFQVEEGLMPPESTEIPPLNETEVQLVRDWVAHGAPVAGDATEPQVEPDSVESVSAESDPTLSGLARFLRFVGKFHPATVHFPVAFLIGALLAEIWHLATGRERMTSALRFCLWMGALSALPAALFGWLHAYHSGYADWTSFADKPMAAHRWLGIATAIWAWVALILGELRQRRESPKLRTWLLGSLLVAALLAALTGFFGGVLTYGLDHYAY